MALISGTIALLFSCWARTSMIFSITAITLGILSLKWKERAKGRAVTGLICGVTAFLAAIIIVISGLELSLYELIQ